MTFLGTATVIVRDWDYEISPMSEKISEIFSLKGVSGEWILHEHKEIKGRYSHSGEIQTVVKAGFTLQRPGTGTTIEVFCDGNIVGKLTTNCGDSVTVSRSNCHQLDVLRSLVSAWD